MDLAGMLRAIEKAKRGAVMDQTSEESVERYMAALQQQRDCEPLDEEDYSQNDVVFCIEWARTQAEWNGILHHLEQCNRLKEDGLWVADLFTAACMRAMPYEMYLQTDHWAYVRAEQMEYEPTCKNCNADHHLEVHHRTYRYLAFETISCLTTLCRGCHAAFHRQRTVAKAQGSA